MISTAGMRGCAVLSNLDVRADCDIHWPKIFGGLITLARSKTVLHHHIVRSRRLGARHGEVGFGESGIDVIRHAAPRSACLDLELGKESTDDRQAGADQANGRLDVCPERGLIDCVCGVLRMHPEQSHNTVYTSEANESTDGEDTVQSELISPVSLQAPDHGHRQTQDDKVHDDVEDLIDNDKQLTVEAFSRDAMIPVSMQRSTLHCTCDEDCSPPGADEAVDSETNMLEYRNRENSAIEADDRDLNERAQSEVGELVCKEDLHTGGVSCGSTYRQATGIDYLVKIQHCLDA